MKSALGLSLWLTFILLLHRRESTWVTFGRRLAFNGISKAEVQPKSQQKCLCTKKWKCSIYPRMETWPVFKLYKAVYTDLSSADFQLTLVLSVCQQSWLVVNGSWLFPGFNQSDRSQGCLQSCGGPWTLLMCTKQLSIVYEIVFSLAVLTAPIPSAPHLSMPLSSHSPGPWHGSATLQPPEDKADRLVSMYTLGTGQWRFQKEFSSGSLYLLHERSGLN